MYLLTKRVLVGKFRHLGQATPKGADSSATIYSIVETSKENSLIPFEYLKYLFDKLPNIDISDIRVLDEFMPWSSSLPDQCRVKK